MKTNMDKRKIPTYCFAFEMAKDTCLFAKAFREVILQTNRLMYIYLVGYGANGKVFYISPKAIVSSDRIGLQCALDDLWTSFHFCADGMGIPKRDTILEPLLEVIDVFEALNEKSKHLVFYTASDDWTTANEYDIQVQAPAYSEGKISAFLTSKHLLQAFERWFSESHALCYLCSPAVDSSKSYHDILLSMFASMECNSFEIVQMHQWFYETALASIRVRDKENLRLYDYQRYDRSHPLIDEEDGLLFDDPWDEGT